MLNVYLNYYRLLIVVCSSWRDSHLYLTEVLMASFQLYPLTIGVA